MRRLLLLMACGVVSSALTSTAVWADSAPATPSSRAFLEIRVPDPRGLLYVDGRRIEPRGASYSLQTPPLEPGQAYYYHVRAAFRSGERLLIEERTVAVHAGRTVAIAFDGKDALSVPLPPATTSSGEELAPTPRVLPPASSGVR
jgi:uncharacterized protein (TIGR03000 family)